MTKLTEILRPGKLRKDQFILIAGPCVIEDDKSPFDIAAALKHLADSYRIPLIFKASYRKANRSRHDSFTGIGDIEALEILKSVSEIHEIPVITDVHSEQDVELVCNYVDILQIPAFLCRQTSLIQAAAYTGKPVNIKKGQFSSAESMRFAVEKVRVTGNDMVLLTERGTSFGYQDLIVDFRGIPVMKSFGVPVILDATHSLQLPNQTSGVSGGMPEMIGTIAKAGIAAGADGLFIETHPRPHKAKSDGANMLPLERMDQLLSQLIKLKKALS